MSKTSNEREFDLRLIERNLRLGKADAKAYQDYLKTLPDSSANVQHVEVFEENNEVTIVDNFGSEADYSYKLEP